MSKSNNSRKPRRLYTRKGPHICFGGGHFGPKEGAETALNVDYPITRVDFNEKEDNEITVSQTVNKKKAVKETWVRRAG